VLKGYEKSSIGFDERESRESTLTRMGWTLLSVVVSLHNPRFVAQEMFNANGLWNANS
jgi:hypothetical protein